MSILKNSKNLAKIGLKNAKSGIQKGGKVVSDKVQIKKPFIDVKMIDGKTKDGKNPKNIGNVWTGKRLNPVHVAGAGGLYLGGKTLKQSVEYNTIQPLQLATYNNYQEQGAPDIMSYDGVGQQAAPKNMNADGSIVFGLHNMRKG